MKWKTSLNIGANARRVLPKLAEKYFEAGRKAAEKHSPKALHRFRISTKRFRYALELFGPVYGTSLKRRLDALHRIQKALGKISDYQSILEMLGDDKAIAAKIERAMKRKTKDFRREWKAFDSDGQLKDWKEYLGHAPRRARTGKPLGTVRARPVSNRAA
jgi:CHAD domain-containing protein